MQECNGAIEDAYDAWPRLRRLHRLISLSVGFQFRLADALVVVTPALAGYVTATTGRRGGFHVVGNGADVDRFHPVALSEKSIGRPYVAFAGALASWQGIDTILDAIRSTAWPSGVDLVIAGDGRERTRVQKAARTDRRIRWLGTIPYRDSAVLMSGSLAALIPKADGPSARFGLSPLKFYEAMACGVPVLVSDLPGLGDIVRAHQCGLTFPAGNAEALARAVAEIVRDPIQASEMGSRGRAAAVSLYSWDARAGQTERVLLKVAGGRVDGREPQDPLDEASGKVESATEQEETLATRAGAATKD